ncbi:MAG: transposase [Halioglobus sp.]|nr:transposase [Halioglobus sp.]
MTLPRRAQVSLAATPYYHVVARCVRRAFLRGADSYTGRNFEHRKQWLLDRITAQASVFAVDVCAYTIMNNHYHLVLRINRDRASQWSDDEVIDRWTQLFSGPIIVQRYKNGEPITAAQRGTVADIVAVWRKRLSDLSWYMRCLNEFIARKANAEDNCTGRFWEGRFKSQALLDEAALISCMAYVDLNPVRAGTAKTLPESDFSSVQSRLASIDNSKPRKNATSTRVPLMSFADALSQPHTREDFLPIAWPAYLALVEATGRQCVYGKRGAISDKLHQGLRVLDLSIQQWDILVENIQASKLPVIGSLDRLRVFQNDGRQRAVGARLLQLVYSNNS